MMTKAEHLLVALIMIGAFMGIASIADRAIERQNIICQEGGC